MPGVPSSRGCDECRKQKKKCDQQKPDCSRCRRLKLSCIGAGQQRYQFKEVVGFANSKTQFVVTSASKSVVRVGWHDNAHVPQAPITYVTILATSLIDTIKPATSLRYNLLWTVGSYLEYIPQRLGTNDALDCAVSVLVDAHTDLCLHRGIRPITLKKYSRALGALRQYLDEPIKARAAETLCAVLLLLTCQSFLGITEKHWGHYEGAVKILKARNFYNHQNEFESQLFLSLRGPVVLGAVFSTNIRLSPDEWESIIINELDPTSGGGIMMGCIAKLPEFIQRGKKAWLTNTQDLRLLVDSRQNYETFKRILEAIHTQVLQYLHIPEEIDDYNTLIKLQAELQRGYVLALAIAIMLNINLRSTDPENEPVLEAEANNFAGNILAYEAYAALYRPLGGSYMTVALQAAWMGSTDPHIKTEIEAVLTDYLSDFPLDHHVKPSDGLDTKFWLLHPRKPAY